MTWSQLRAAMVQQRTAEQLMEEATKQKRSAILALRRSPKWDRQKAAEILGVSPLTVDRLVREAKLGGREQRGDGR